MGKALQVVSGFITAPTAAFATVSPSGTDTFAVENYYQGSMAAMINAWADIDTVGQIRFRSPNFHDNVNGIHQEVAAVSPISVLPGYMSQILQANDTINAELADDGTGGPSGLTIIEYYDNLPGADANLYRWAEIEGQIVDYMSCQVDVTTAGTPGQYDGAVAINALEDQFKASTNYALLGWTTDTQFQTIGVTGADTSNRRVGGPGTSPEVFDVRNWFIELSLQSGYPTIPVFNSQNMNGTIVDVIDTEAAGSGSITFLFARLSTPGR